MKTCTQCHNELPLSSFYTNYGKPKAACKKCELKRHAKWYAKKGRAYHKNWLANLPAYKKAERCKAAKDWQTRNADRYTEYCRLWRLENPGIILANMAKRRAALMNAVPPWLTEAHKEQIKLIYAQAKFLTKATGIEHQVDHIIPLRGRRVRGLHVPWNLQILPKAENLKKSNKVL